MPNYDTLWQVAQDPTNGQHFAICDRAALVDTRNGEQIITEWHDAQNPGIQWQSWNNFSAMGINFTRSMLLGFGADASIMDDDALGDLLDSVVGYTWSVSLKVRAGDSRVFVDTDVLGKATDAQQAKGLNGEADTRGLPEPSRQPVPAKAEDDDIPFMWEGTQEWNSVKCHSHR